MSLAFALQALAHEAGYTIDHDDLNAALGLSWMTTAVPGEVDLARWPMYARDAFLIPAGRLFCMTIREIHPPEAARGLSALPEFEQHFDASYRPLVVRALEHDQTVLAWQGWPGDQTMSWGVITATCDDGIGLSGWVPCPGRVPWPSEAPPCGTERESAMPAPSARAYHPHHALTLVAPPVQLYVVETITPTQSDPDELLEVVLSHAGQILDNALTKRFGVLTGPAAYDAWIAKLREERAADADDSNLAQGHRQLAASVLASHHSGIRFLERQLPRTASTMHSLLETLLEKCQTIVTAIDESLDATADDAWASTPAGRAKAADPIARALDTSMEMLTALKKHTKTTRSA